MSINEFLDFHKVISGNEYPYRELAPRVKCADGLAFSAQVSYSHYCTPRQNDAGVYWAIEIGYPSQRVEEFMPYAEDELNPTNTVYGYVPVTVVDAVIEKHGGIVSKFAPALQ